MVKDGDVLDLSASMSMLRLLKSGCVLAWPGVARLFKRDEVLVIEWWCGEGGLSDLVFFSPAWVSDGKLHDCSTKGLEAALLRIESKNNKPF